MKKKWFSAILVGLFIVALTGSAFAWSGKADISGKPDELSSYGQEGYYIWQDNNGFHIWTTTRGEEHVFSGVIRTDGDFFHIRGHRLEQGDSFKDYSEVQGRTWFDAQGKNRGNRFSIGGREVSHEGDKIRFKFETTGGSDGINFRVSNANFVAFDLYIDGHPINRKKINIGEESWHPQSPSFRDRKSVV